MDKFYRSIPNTRVMGSLTLFVIAVVGGLKEGFNKELYFLGWNISLLLIYSSIVIVLLTLLYEAIVKQFLLRYNKKLVAYLERGLNFASQALKRIYLLVLWPIKIFIVKPIFDELYEQKNLGVQTVKDDFSNSLSKWAILEGSPLIDPEDRGTLVLPYPGNNGRNSMLGLSNIEVVKGTIKAEVYLVNQESLINFVIGADDSYTNYFMVRVDARHNGEIGLLLAKGKYDWGYIESVKKIVPHNKWLAITLLFDMQNIKLLVGDQIFFEHHLTNTLIPIGRVGMFNEVGPVKLRSFELIQD